LRLSAWSHTSAPRRSLNQVASRSTSPTLSLVGSSADLGTALRRRSYGNFQEVRNAIKSIDARLLVSEEETADSVVHRAQAGTRFSLLLIGVFAGIAWRWLRWPLRSALHRRPAAHCGNWRAHAWGRAQRYSALDRHAGLRLSVVASRLLCHRLLLGRVITAMLVEVKPTDPATFAA